MQCFGLPRQKISLKIQNRIPTTSTRRITRKFKLPQLSTINCICIDEACEKGALALYHGTIAIISLTQRKILTSFQAHDSHVLTVKYAKKDAILISSSRDTTIKLWETENYQLMKIFDFHSESVLSLSLQDDFMVSGALDKKITLWDLNSLSLINYYDNQDPVLSLSMCQDYIAAGSKNINIWKINTLINNEQNKNQLPFFQQQLKKSTISLDKVLIGHEKEVTVLVFLEENRLASGSHDCQIFIWDVMTGETVRILSGHQKWVLALAASGDGRQLVRGGGDQTLILWNLETFKQEDLLPGHDDYVKTLTFTKNGELLLSGSFDQSVHVWDYKHVQRRRQNQILPVFGDFQP